jgi:predicted cupin superfamily sugar epimerase
MSAPLTPEGIIAHLKLGPHPEGSYFRKTFRGEPGDKGRAHSTAILYLLRAGDVFALASRRRRRDLALVWGRAAVARDQAWRGAVRISPRSGLA